jgi:phosphorylcholine metabolism protein LicD
VDIDFANLKVPAPADSHAYLRTAFGDDYMTPPPLDQRVSHTHEVLFDAV